MSGNPVTEQLLRDGESAKVEFKSSASDRDAIGRAVCAFLNTHGGVVLVGVDDGGRPNDTASQRQAESLREFLHAAISPQVLFTVTLDQTSAGPVIAVEVPNGPDRPYVFAGAAYIRTRSATKPADTKALRSMVERGSQETARWERRPCLDLEISDLDLELLNETVRRAQDRRGYRFDDPRDASAVLSGLALMRFGQLTNAAEVLFGKKVALRHPQTRLRAVCYATDRADDFLDERLFEGPAFTLLENTMAFLRRHVPIAAEFPAGRLPRDSKPRYPFNALREGLVNALVHRDYAAFSGSVSVSVYPDRVEIWNTGRLPRGISPRELLLPSHNSILVNPDIAHVFYLHELMERVGRGTYKIVQECRDMGMPMPEWKNSASGVRLTLFAAGPVAPRTPKLNDRQRTLLDALVVGDQIRMWEFVERFATGVTSRQARRDLSELEAHGFLERRGAGSKTTYERTDRSP
jgi:ATP-dependent DNA helicase RecG